MAVSERKILSELWSLAVGFLGIVARFAIVIPVCFCAYDFLTATWSCIAHSNFPGYRLEMPGCPLVGLFFMYAWMVEPYTDSSGAILPHFHFMSLVALSIAIAWAVIDHRQSGKRRRQAF